MVVIALGINGPLFKPWHRQLLQHIPLSLLKRQKTTEML